jgi:hypothetical protein
MRKSSWVFIALLVSAMVTIPACKAPAEFEVVSLDIVPAEVTAGETVSVTAEVRNTGGSEGVYTAILTVDGVEMETKEVTITPDASKTVTFSLVKDTPGTYQVGIGGLTSSLTVKQKLVELKYDDGEACGFIAGWPPTGIDGFLVDFAPPSVPFTIKGVRIYGTIYGNGWEGKDFDVEIWDEDEKVLHSAKYPFTKFPTATWEDTFNQEDGSWVEVDVPDLKVTDKFYVHVYTGNGPLEGIHIGADDSVVNKHSESTNRTDGTTLVFPQWPYSRDWGWFGDKSKVNWMIRVVGTTQPTIIATQASKPTADFVWDGKYAGAGEVVKFSDNSQNAVSWFWDFGDDSLESSKQNPHHSYWSPGVYSVTLRVENPSGADEKTQKVFIFKKGEIYLLKLEVSPDPEALQADVEYKATTTYLADLAAGEPEILNLSFFWDQEGPFKFNGSIFGKVKLVEYGTLWISLWTGNPGRYKLRCYVEYKLPDGTVKQSNEVSTYITVK